MQLEDLQQQWHQLDQKLDQSLALQTAVAAANRRAAGA